MPSEVDISLIELLEEGVVLDWPAADFDPFALVSDCSDLESRRSDLGW